MTVRTQHHIVQEVKASARAAAAAVLACRRFIRGSIFSTKDVTGLFLGLSPGVYVSFPSWKRRQGSWRVNDLTFRGLYMRS